VEGALTRAQIGLHSILSLTHEGYGHATSINNIKGKLGGPAAATSSSPNTTATVAPGTSPAAPAGLLSRRANATLLMLARNTDLDNAVRSVRRLEDRFNRHFNYPWLFLNDAEFDDNFKNRLRVLVSGEVTFATVPKDHWEQPDWIDEEKATAERKKMTDEGVIYGGSKSYRNMCRFNSGVRAVVPSGGCELTMSSSSSSSTPRSKSTAGTGESSMSLPKPCRTKHSPTPRPDVHFHCDLEFDPFLFMQDHNKTYGFTIALYEYRRTIETLWPTVKGPCALLLCPPRAG
jgi:alpha 1,2-mannosyltransferase